MEAAVSFESADMADRLRVAMSACGAWGASCRVLTPADAASKVNEFGREDTAEPRPSACDAGVTQW